MRRLLSPYLIGGCDKKGVSGKGVIGISLHSAYCLYLYQAESQPYKQQAQAKAAGGIEKGISGMLILEQGEKFVGKGGEGCKSPTETGSQ